MKETVLVIGSGAREHAIAAALARSSHQPEIVCFGSARNPGIEKLCRAYKTGSMTNPGPMLVFGVDQRVTLCIVGPEAPLAVGVADAFWEAGIPVVGPRQSLARIEWSKGYTRDLLSRHKIEGNPFFQRFGPGAAEDQELDELLRRYAGKHVIKDDGLAGGKGVKVCGDHLHSLEDSLRFCKELASHGRPFVVEEKLEGEEFSLLSFCDGKTLRHMPAVQDHKRAFEGDLGPNTGGMGTYTDADGRLPFLTEEHIAEARVINERVVAALRADCGTPYKGVLYGGFMATADGVRLIEYNARFGDPECLNLLTLLRTDFLQICCAIVSGALDECDVEFAAEASVCKYIVPEGYPEAPRVGDEVRVPEDVPEDVTLYLGAVDERDGKLVATGSRTVGVVGVAETLSDAEELCESVASRWEGPFFHRADIGTEAALRRRAEHMRSLGTE
jgi:phosphoribosylamine---glycine ligase